MSEKFIPVETSNGQQLHLPVAEATRWGRRPEQQELAAQKEVIGTDGHGSIRAESSSDISADKIAEDLDKSITDMLDPRNVIELKDQLEQTVDKNNSESTYLIDKRHDKDGEKVARKETSRDQLKAELIEKYTQIGTDPEKPREIPDLVKSDISRMLDMSFEELESLIKEKQGTGQPSQKPGETHVTPIDENTSSGRYRFINGQPVHPEYDGPVKKGMEVELYDGPDTQPPKTPEDPPVVIEPPIEPPEDPPVVIEPPEEPIVIDPEREATREQLELRLQTARERYIDVSSKRRKVSFGLRKDRKKETLEDAREEYYSALMAVGNMAREDAELAGMTEDELLNLAKLTQSAENNLMAELTTAREAELANGQFMGAFNNWWTRNSTNPLDPERKPKFGKLKKVAMMAGLATVASTGVGLVATGAIGAVSAVGLPGIVAARFAKGQAVSKFTRNANGLQRAVAHNGAVLRESSQIIQDADRLLTPEELDAAYSGKTKEIVNKNRRRIAASLAIGAIAVYGVDRIKDVFDGDTPGPGGGSPETDPTPEPPETDPTPEPEIPRGGEIVGLRDFNIEAGNGITHEMQDFFVANGVNDLSPEKLYEIYQRAEAQLGIDGMIENPDEYALNNGDAGISSPTSNGEWTKGMRRFLRSELRSLRN